MPEKPALPPPPTKPTRRWSLKWVVGVGILLLAGALAAWWFTRAPLVSAVIVREGPLVRSLQFSARVSTLSRVDVGSTLTGRVAQVAVNQGAQVKAGEVLVVIESDELRAALEQAQAGRFQADARLAGLRSTGRATAIASVTQAQAVLVAAQAESQRTQELVAKGFVSMARLDEVQRAVAVAQAQLEAAKAQSAANAEGGTDVVQARAQVAAAASTANAARARLGQTAVTAPADAKVLARLVEPGQIVQPGRALLSLALSGPLQLIAQVDERYLEQLALGQSASVVADAYPNAPFAAKVLTIAPLVDAQRGAVEVKFEIVAPLQDFLREDMTLSVEVFTARRERSLVVPLAALKSGANVVTGSVLLDVAGRVQAREVRLGLRTLESAEVLEGLAPGDLVLLGDAPQPGRRVRSSVLSPAAVASAARRSGKPEDAGSALTNAVGR